MSPNQTVAVDRKGQGRRMPDPEVSSKANRRQFSQEYKLRILAEADNCTEPGQIGALLRSEGLYDSHLTRWRQARKAGRLGGQEQRHKRESMAELRQEVAQLRREQARLQQELQQAELIIDVQKKLSQLLGLTKQEANRNS